ncbi:MAG: M55 family metallopeptidase [Desulfurococcales archaeon]|nr:M55 family metallopeptidase [Desulfurococcales archaeon]
MGSKPLKVFISVDAEGMPFAASRSMWSPNDPYYNETRENMTSITSTVIQALTWLTNEKEVKEISRKLENLFIKEHASDIISSLSTGKPLEELDTLLPAPQVPLEVVVADSHGSMMNIEPMKLWSTIISGLSESLCTNSLAKHETRLCNALVEHYVGSKLLKISLVRGFPRPLSMVNGAEGSDFAVFLGYHATPPMGGLLGHTMSGRIVQRMRIKGEDDASEYLLNTLMLGEIGVPIALVAGDETLRGQVEKHTPWAVFVPLTQKVSSLASTTPSPYEYRRMLWEGLSKAFNNYKSGELKPLLPEEPWVEVEFKRPWFADVAELIPCTKRVDGLRVRFECDTIRKSFAAIEAAILAAYSVAMR